MAESERVMVGMHAAILKSARQWRSEGSNPFTDRGLVVGILEALGDPTPAMMAAGYAAADADIGGDWSGRVEIQSVIGRSVWRAMLAELRKEPG